MGSIKILLTTAAIISSVTAISEQLINNIKVVWSSSVVGILEVDVVVSSYVSM